MMTPRTGQESTIYPWIGAPRPSVRLSVRLRRYITREYEARRRGQHGLLRVTPRSAGTIRHEPDPERGRTAAVRERRAHGNGEGHLRLDSYRRSRVLPAVPF